MRVDESARRQNRMQQKYNDNFYCPPAATTAGLMYPARSKKTARGFTLAYLPAEKRWRQIISASQAERETCLLLLAQQNLWNLHDQPNPVTFTDLDGTKRTHRFDYLVEFRDGSKIAVAVKPESRVKSLNFRDTLAAIERDLPLGFADKVCLVTERNRHPDEVHNAQLLNFFRRCPDHEADSIVSEGIASLTGETTIAELLEPTRLDGRGFRAIFRAIYDGKLTTTKQERISSTSIVTPSRVVQ